MSHWFDFDTLLYCLENNSNIEFHIIGPLHVDVARFKHNRLFFHGVINHSELQAYVEKYDALIMPFIINDLILSVDPVKLYEYINFNKPIFSIYYDEIKDFQALSNFIVQNRSFHNCSVIAMKYWLKSMMKSLEGTF